MKKSEKEHPTGPESSRRGFLTNLWIVLGVVAIAEFFTVAFTFLRPAKSKARQGVPDAVVTAGLVDTFKVNSVTAFVRGRFYLTRLEDGGFLALSRKCTHLGCTVPWMEKKSRFECPCHASVFDIKGDVISPPAPRALDTYPVIIENDMVKVNTGKPLKRNEFRAEQVAYPKKT